MEKIKIFKALSITIAIIAGTSCSNSPSAKDTNNDQIKSVSEMTKEFVESNDYIDIDPLEINDMMAKETRSSFSEENEAKAHAVLYRFYSHVSIVDGKYTTTLKSASDINISEKAFNYLMDNLVQVNESLDAAYKNGEQVELADIGEEYLNHLLNK